nr:acidic leucine-rich nuclear phosphoprotein 32-related protein [Ipomoea batatas]GMD43904.1 acidic leucine-rich nuclear phosphoprotein 32-related protein [Ipomoea batatas]
MDEESLLPRTNIRPEEVSAAADDEHRKPLLRCCGLSFLSAWLQLMDEIWERAVETTLDGQTDFASVRTLTLDGAVKCVHGRLPPPALFERFQNLQHLSIANIGVSSLEQFPRLHNLQKLILLDNRIAAGLEFLVEAGLNSLRDLDLSNNRIQDIDDLRPLAELKLVSLDLYECSVTRVKDYRSRVNKALNRVVDQQTKLNFMPSDGVSSSIPPLHPGKFDMELMREYAANWIMMHEHPFTILEEVGFNLMMKQG